jgi:hypothetical protein
MKLFSKSGLKSCFLLSMTVIAAQAQGGGDRPPTFTNNISIEDLEKREKSTRLDENARGVAAFMLGQAYYFGKYIGVPQDAAKAAVWYRKAAERGNGTARFMLAGMYAKGDGVPKDPVQAVFWYSKCAADGNQDARKALGEMYANGDGVPKDLVIAYKWNDMWWDRDSAIDNSAREALKKLMTPAQRAQIEKLNSATPIHPNRGTPDRP